MLLEQFRESFASLPDEAQRKVSIHLASMIARYHKEASEAPIAKTPLSEEPFIGVWAERIDMDDSSKWVREIREREWKR